jgi:hypothetical protein
MCHFYYAILLILSLHPTKTSNAHGTLQKDQPKVFKATPHPNFSRINQTKTTKA